MLAYNESREDIWTLSRFSSSRKVVHASSQVSNALFQKNFTSSSSHGKIRKKNAKFFESEVQIWFIVIFSILYYLKIKTRSILKSWPWSCLSLERWVLLYFWTSLLFFYILSDWINVTLYLVFFLFVKYSSKYKGFVVLWKVDRI